MRGYRTSFHFLLMLLVQAGWLARQSSPTNRLKEALPLCLQKGRQITGGEAHPGSLNFHPEEAHGTFVSLAKAHHTAISSFQGTRMFPEENRNYLANSTNDYCPQEHKLCHQALVFEEFSVYDNHRYLGHVS